MKIFLVSAVIVAATLNAQTSFNAGDLAIIGVNSDNPDTLAFVVFTDVEANTTVNFTDNGWENSGSFRGGEGVFTYEFQSAASAGTIFSMNTTGMALAASGDQILAYQGDFDTPSFIYGLHTYGNVWDSDATNTNESALPTGLIDGTTAVAIGSGPAGSEVDNGVFDTSVLISGTVEEWLTAIGDSSNWTTSNTPLDMPLGSLALNAVPEPAAFAFAVGVFALIYVARWRSS
ncbi:MAG: hypothetical protein AAF212_10180 [Verrucomicrobiota bacterium]